MLFALGRTDESLVAVERADQLYGDPNHLLLGDRALRAKQDDIAIAHFEALLQQHNYPDSTWVRELITAGRNPATGQTYLDRRIPEIIASIAEGSGILSLQHLQRWYLIFGFLDRYFEIILDRDPNDSRWDLFADIYLYDGIVHRRMGFTAHPKYLEVAEAMGIIKIWEKRGPPDFCEKVGGQWVCE